MRIGVFGAGAIGTYVGGQLAAAGHRVVLVGRPALVEARDGMSIEDLGGAAVEVADRLEITADPDALRDVDACLVCVKSGDTRVAAESLSGRVGAQATVVSLQNGLRNVPVLEEALGRPVVAGMVTFNVRREGQRFRRATTGPVVLGAVTGRDGERALAIVEALRARGEEASLRKDMLGVQVGKLLLNLNNGLCAVTGLSIADSIRSRPLRLCFSACLSEGLAVVRAAGLPVSRIGPLAPGLVAQLLRLPDALFFRIARSMLAIDPAARSSTLQDLDRGKATEIDYLNGEIVALAAKHGVGAPLNGWVTTEVHAIEHGAGFRSTDEVREAQKRARQQAR